MLKVIVEAAPWAAARDQPLFRPPELDALGHVSCATAEDLAAPGGDHPLRLVLDIDSERLAAPVDRSGPRARILGPIDRNAVVAAVPLRPRTPDGHTLQGVLTGLHVGDRDDPELLARLDRAFGRELELVRGWVRAELRGWSAAEVEEVTQDVLAEGWAKLPEYVPNARFRSWLRQIALFKCSTVRRKRRDALTEDGMLDPACDQPDALRRLEDRRRDDLVEEAARAVLSPLDQEIALLRYVFDYPLEDIAVRLADSGHADAPREANGVRVALQRIRRRLMGEIGRRLGDLDG